MSNGSTTVESAQGKCDLFVSHFSSFFSTHSPDSDQVSLEPPTREFPGRDVFRAITSLPARTASSPDGISSQMLKGTAEVTSSSLSTLFNLSLRKGPSSEWWLYRGFPLSEVKMY